MKSNYTQLVVKNGKGFVVEAVIEPTVEQVKEYSKKYEFYRCYSKDSIIIFDAR